MSATQCRHVFRVARSSCPACLLQMQNPDGNGAPLRDLEQRYFDNSGTYVHFVNLSLSGVRGIQLDIKRKPRHEQPNYRQSRTHGLQDEPINLRRGG
jgi:hypothetical protein